MKILIAGAWPYTNGPLHIGHISALLPGDVLARYHRLKGDEVAYVSGSDCHGTPISLRAKKEKKTPYEISQYYHEEFLESFEYFGFSYDYYGRTSSEGHKKFVRQFHKGLYESEFVKVKNGIEAYCPKCKKTLADRLLIGICCQCGEKSNGEQCDRCGTVFQTGELIEGVCAVCNEHPEYRKSKHLYLLVPELEEELLKLMEHNQGWRKNALDFTKRYLREGLRERAITRDIDWGIEVPLEGFAHKKIYIWAENVLGYLSSTWLLLEGKRDGFNSFWKSENTRHYYVHGKDNIPFHSIILPSLLLASGEGYHMPDRLISSEHLTLDGRKISTSQQWAVWVNELIGKFNPDALRYYLLAHGPEKRDADFTWEEFRLSNNSELLGGYGNLVNRTVVFVHKYFDGYVPKGHLESWIDREVEVLFQKVGNMIEGGEFKDGIKAIFRLVKKANKYFDSEKPWVTVRENSAKCQHTIYNCLQLIGNIALLLAPYLPFSSKSLEEWLGLVPKWAPQLVEERKLLPKSHLLFTRIDKG